ncbi:hypothetical protein [Pectinatus frisingensis]|uniref:hypothetical protein n=1 Tax=Pectinatus frisingensis TaxID=865 RepID=UPI0018C5CCAE|nr:hypothetical protein [Pectinatus frisingensis]
MKRILLLTLLLCIISGTVFAQVYTNPQNVSITVPDNWQMRKDYYSAEKNSYTTLLGDGKIQICELISVINYNVPENATLDILPDEKIINIISSMFGKFAISSDIKTKPNFKRITINGYPAIISDFTIVKNNISLSGRIYITLKNSKLIGVYYMTMTDNMITFLPVIEKSINTLTVN